MSSLHSVVRDAPFGQLVRAITKNRFFRYPEELPGFQIPWQNVKAIEKEEEAEEVVVEPQPDLNIPKDDSSTEVDPSLKDIEVEDPKAIDPEALEQTVTAQSYTGTHIPGHILTRETTAQWTPERLAVEQAEEAARSQSNIISPTKTQDGIIVVDWYTTDDQANPQNWSSGRKALVAANIFFYTFAAYSASAIYTPSEGGVMRRFHVSETKAALGLSVYVLGYGTGPLIFSPLSEIAVIGRNLPYIVTFGLFVILAVPTALVDSYGALITLRLITGILSSPALATGGATMGDMYGLLKLPYALSVWVAAAFCAPALGPLLSGFAVMNEGFRWSFWIILWMSSPVWLFMFFFMPETSASNILLRRAQRLRKLTGDNKYKAQSEIDKGTKSFKHVALEQLLKPMEICIKDPAVLFTNIYTSAIYAIYYSFFEVFPLVYIGIYDFNLGELGLPFLTVIIGCVIGMAIYFAFLYYYLEPDIKAHGLRAQEHRLVPALFAVTLLPAGLFWFGWTSEKSIHWIVPTIGLTLFPIGAFILFQCIFIYLPLTYPMYAASLFAANDFCRSAMAAGAILYAHPLFTNLGIGKGVSVLAGLLCGGVVGVWVLYFTGAKLRARSSFAMS